MDPTIILPAVGTREPNAVTPRVHSTTDDPVVVGDIPASRLGLQPRPALLARLNRASQGTPVVLTGARGAGKTQLAATYARAKLADNWRLIAWVNARNSETLLAGLTAVADSTPGYRWGVPGRTRPTRARRSGTGWRLTGAFACWCSMTSRILVCCGRSYRPPGRPGY